VRHAKHKRRDANALSLKLMDRIVSLASDPGSVVLDPFGGSGTTYVAAELTGRRWIGAELDCSSIIERCEALEADRQHLAEIHENKNVLFKRSDLATRRKNGRPLSKNYRLPETKAALVCTDPAHAQVEMF
jgi:site-specific DNA-methyltransferase (adenine-specific)